MCTGGPGQEGVVEGGAHVPPPERERAKGEGCRRRPAAGSGAYGVVFARTLRGEASRRLGGQVRYVFCF